MDLSQLSQYGHGIFNEHLIFAIAGVVLAVLIIGYTGLPVWSLAALVFLYGFGAPLWLLAVVGIVALVANVTPLRANIVSRPIMNLLKSMGFLPTISETERIALDAGTVWVDGEFFSGKPDFKK